MLDTALLISPWGAPLWARMAPHVGASLRFPVLALEGRTFRDVAIEILKDAPPFFWAVAHCMGAFVVLELLKHAPDRVLGAAFINAAPANDSPSLRVRRIERIAKLEAAAQVGKFPDCGYANHAAQWFVADAGRRAAGRHMVAGMLQDLPLASTIAQQRAMLDRSDYEAIVRTISECSPRPLVVAGSVDRVCLSLDAVAYWRACGLAPHILDGCGHVAPIERPRQTARLLNNWIQGAERAK